MKDIEIKKVKRKSRLIIVINKLLLLCKFIIKIKHFAWSFRFDRFFKKVNPHYINMSKMLRCTCNNTGKNTFHQIKIKLYDLLFSRQQKINVFFYMCICHAK